MHRDTFRKRSEESSPVHVLEVEPRQEEDSGCF